MPTFKHALVILNPTSGQHTAEVSQKGIEGVLKEYGITCEVGLTTREKGASIWAANASDKDFDLIVGAGGDGTITEIVNGLLKASVTLPLMVVSIGTANGLARLLGLPLNLEGAIKVGLEGDISYLDVGYIINKDYYFLLFFGAGYDAEVIRTASREQKNRYGLWAYILAAFKNLRNRHNQRIRLELDRKQYKVFAHSIITFNASKFVASGLPLGPNVNPQDGRLNLVILREPTLWGILGQLWQLLIASFISKNLTIPVRRIHIDAVKPLTVHADGEVLGKTPVDIELKVKAACLLAPKSFLERQTAWLY